MSLLLDQQYAGMLAPFVRNFVKKGTYKFNFSCPFCGDSSKVKSRSRGYLLPAANHLSYYCHNCNIPNQTLRTLLKHIDGNLYQQYIIDSFKEKDNDKNTGKQIEKIEKKKGIQRRIDRNLTPVVALPDDHYCVQYLKQRKIDSAQWDRLYFTETFKAWAHNVRDNLFDDIKFDEPRLVIPLIDRDNNVLGYQGRAFIDVGVKYLTVLLEDDNPKVFGLDRVDFNKKINCFEGPIDAMFIPNSIAASGGRIDSIVSDVGIGKDRAIIVYDNEPRSLFTIKKLEKAIDDGWTVCVWPSNAPTVDVNKMIVDYNMTPDQIEMLIAMGACKGLDAKLKLAQWRKR